MIPMIIFLLVTSFVKGRFWCGNFCPRGSFLEMFVKRITHNSAIPAFFKSMKFRLPVFVLFLVIFALRVWSVFLKGDVFEKLGIFLASMCLVTTIIATILGFYYAPRAWCSFCPMGTLQNQLSRLSTKISTFLGVSISSNYPLLDKNICKKCGKCSKVCPMQLKPYKQGQKKL
ncbi:MAG: 4Fe-4S binding protein [Nanoarchaeota archaeon]